MKHPSIWVGKGKRNMCQLVEKVNFSGYGPIFW